MCVKNIIYFTLLVPFFAFAQNTKLMSDTLFKKGDNIKIFEIRYSLDGNGKENDDSLKILAEFINVHKNIVFEIGSHTDARGSVEKNNLLSKKRAASIRQVLIERFGVNAYQLKAKGYGSSKLIKKTKEIALLQTREEMEMYHQMNRRTELKVLEIK